MTFSGAIPQILIIGLPGSNRLSNSSSIQPTAPVVLVLFGGEAMFLLPLSQNRISQT